MFVVRERDVVCCEFSVNFNIVSVFFFVNKLYGFVRAFRKSFAQIANEERFVVYGFFTVWHGVDLDGGWCIAAECIKGFIDPGLEAESVIEEDVSILESNEIRSRWFIIVDGDVV